MQLQNIKVNNSKLLRKAQLLITFLPRKAKKLVSLS
jgi:hypothetical protein